MRLRCFLTEIRGERSLREVVNDFHENGGRSSMNGGELSRIENGIVVPRDEDLAPLERAYGASVEDWYSNLALLALESDDAKLASIRARLRTTLLPH